jgi:hypothetical protein
LLVARLDDSRLEMALVLFVRRMGWFGLVAGVGRSVLARVDPDVLPSIDVLVPDLVVVVASGGAESVGQPSVPSFPERR